MPRRRTDFENAALPHIRDLYAIAVRTTRDPVAAEDLVQETYLRAYTAWASFEPGSNCRAWLIRILMNSYINHYRRARSHKAFVARSPQEKQAALYGDEPRATSRDPEDLLARRGFGDEVTRALGSLERDYQVVVLLADIEGMKYRDIAHALGCPIGTVMSRLFRARRQLEAVLGTYAAQTGIARAA
jgi:RNA polymerase sigma-70 factor (ECF subfamily)